MMFVRILSIREIALWGLLEKEKNQTEVKNSLQIKQHWSEDELFETAVTFVNPTINLTSFN